MKPFKQFINESSSEKTEWKPVTVETLKQKKSEGKGYSNRAGIEHAWYNLGGLKAGLETRKRQAEEWRNELLQHLKNGPIEERSISLLNRYGNVNRHKGVEYRQNGKLFAFRKGYKIYYIKQGDQIVPYMYGEYVPKEYEEIFMKYLSTMYPV